MQLHNCVLDALEHVLAWDLPDEACPDAVTTQTAMLAGISPDELGVSNLD